MKNFLLIIICLLPVLGVTQPGSLDTSFDPGTGANNGILSTSIQNDGKIVIGGGFTTYNGTTRNGVARINVDGSLDTSFDPGTGLSSGTHPAAFTTVIQSDGKIIVGGSFSSYNGTMRNNIARLNSDGSLDTSFDPGTGADGAVHTTSIQSDGKIIIGGSFSQFDGMTRNGIVRLNIDGSIDFSFISGTGVSDSGNPNVQTTNIQSDGKIIIGGRFTTYNGTSRNYIARLNVDGSLDTTFDPGTGANTIIYTTSIQSDGKIIIGGAFTLYNGTEIIRIARLNTDGSLDSSFDPGLGANLGVHSASIQSDGKIIIGGWFSSYDGTARNGIALLNVDGSLDTFFDPGSGLSGGLYPSAYSFSTQSDGKIIIGGEFDLYDGTLISHIARINSTITSIISLENEINKAYVFPNPLGNTGILYSNIELKNAALTIFSLSGQSLIKIENIYGNSINLNRDNLPAGMYLIQLLHDDQIIMCDKLAIRK